MSKDEELKNSVLAELKQEPSISSAHIGVTAEDGTVTLTGHVETYGQKRAAEMATGRVKGVKAVAEEIEIRLPFTVKHDDAQIAKAAADRLEWDAETPRDAVKVKVEKGWITLTGTVAQHFQKDAAEREVRGLSGVVGVFNQISIKPRVDTAHVSEDIRHALHRGWLNPDNIKVTEHDGNVKLTGTVENWQERQTAGATAWAAPGANSVENDLIVAWQVQSHVTSPPAQLSGWRLHRFQRKFGAMLARSKLRWLFPEQPERSRAACPVAVRNMPLAG